MTLRPSFCLTRYCQKLRLHDFPGAPKGIHMPTKNERISFDLPMVPYSVRAFIEKAVNDERTMLSFVESPGTALRAALSSSRRI
jgi:hypothetical protein